jgi:hypothetical protein
MKEPWSSRWYCSLLLAIASMLGLIIVVVMIVGAVAGNTVGPAPQTTWKDHLDGVDDALSRSDLGGAEAQWAKAYAAALKSHHWEGMVAVGDAYRRLGALGGFQETAAAKARKVYLAALFRARSEASIEGVLEAARGFAELGDQTVVERCLDVARSIAAQSRDPRAEERVRAFAERWSMSDDQWSVDYPFGAPVERVTRRTGAIR